MISRSNGIGASRLGALMLASLLVQPASAVAAPVVAPAAFGVEDLTPVLVAHAEGVQLYECKPDATGVTVWTLREPIAALMSDGKTVGRHYVGPTWELDDGSVIKGKLIASAPGATSSDIPLLKLSVAEHRGIGVLNDVKLVLRLNTKGGSLKGGCAVGGEFRSEPYSADYAFLP